MINWAKNELSRIDHDAEGLQDMADANVLELLQVFCNQNHSNMSAPYILSVFNRLSHWLPLTPLTGEDDEWNEVGSGIYQNNRCMFVFKDADGKAYNMEGKIFSTDNGETWFTNKDSRVYINFPYYVPDKPEKVYLPQESGEGND